MRMISEEELNSLKLVESSKNDFGKSVVSESLPSILHWRAPRVVKGQKWFTEFSQQRPMHFGETVCECCGKYVPKRTMLERHELYELCILNEDYVIRLKDVLRICKECHEKIHYEHSVRRTSKYGFIRDFSPVSRLSVNLWNRAKYLLIENELYLFEELK